MADSDTALAALNQARQWALENVDFDVSNVEVDGEYLVVDFRVTGPGGKVWFDDRNRIFRPRLWTEDGTTTPTTEYRRPNGTKVYLTQAQFNALTRTQQRALTATGRTWDKPNFEFAPRRAILKDLLHTAKLVTKDWTVPHVMRDANGNLLGDTLTVFSQDDGNVNSSNGTIGTARSGSGLSANTGSASSDIQSSFAFSLYIFGMGFIAFDTSGLGSGATITGAVVSLAGDGNAETNTNSPTIQIKYKDYGSGNPSTADWFNITTTGWTSLVDVGSKTLSSWTQTSGTYNAFSDAGNYGSINTTGVTRMVIGTSLFPTGTPTGTNEFFPRFSEQTGTTADPKLVITYTAAVDASITGVTATASAAGVVGSVTAQVAASVTGVTGAASAAGIVGSLTTVQTSSITGVTATASAAGVVGSVTAQLVASVTGVTAEATADGVPGVANTGLNANIDGATATADAAGVVGAVSTVQIASISGETASATAAGVAGAVTAGVTTSISGVTATASSAGISGAVTAQLQVSVSGVTGTASAAGIIGAVAAVQIISITGTTATATATGYGGTVSIIANISGVTATASATGIAGAMFFGVFTVDLDIARTHAVALSAKKTHEVELELSKTHSVDLGTSLTHTVELGIAQAYQVEITMSNLTVYEGQSISATGTFTIVSSGAAIDPDTITFKVRDNDGTVTPYVYGTDSEVSKSSTGIYVCAFTASSGPGTWKVQAAGTGAAAAVSQDTFVVEAAL